MDLKNLLPTTVASALVLLFMVFPGLLGERIYRAVIGVDWREKDWRTVLRLVGFSVVGVTLYALFASSFNLYGPIHLLPTTYTQLGRDGSGLNLILLTYSGHLVGGGFAGLLGAAGTLLLGRISSDSIHPSAWEEFVRRDVGHHWVILTLSNGDAYAGRLRTADCGVAASERDLVLEEPAQYDKDARQYISLAYQHLFIRAGDLFSIATVHDPAQDKRMIPIGESPFPVGDSPFTEAKNDQQSDQPELAARARGQGDLPPASSDDPPVGSSPAAAAATAEVEN